MIVDDDKPGAWDDPIVFEVGQVREAIFAAADFDLEKLGQRWSCLPTGRVSYGAGRSCCPGKIKGTDSGLPGLLRLVCEGRRSVASSKGRAKFCGPLARILARHPAETQRAVITELPHQASAHRPDGRAAAEAEVTLDALL